MITSGRKTNNRILNQQNYWDAEAERYIKRYSLDSPNAQRKIQRKAKLLIAGAGITEKSVVLEIGCGTGVFTKELAKTGAYIRAIDLSPNMIQQAKGSRFPDVFYSVGDIHNMVFLDNTFDVVSGCYILQYLDMDKALPEIKRILRPGGHVAFIDINTLHPVAFAKTKLPFVKKWLNISKEAVSFTPWELRKWFTRYGFTDVGVKPFEFGNKALNILEDIPVIRQFGGSLLVTGTK